MQYVILDASGGARNGKPKCAREVRQNSGGVKHFLEGVKKNLGGFNPPNPPPENPPMVKVPLETTNFLFFSALLTP